MKKIFLIFFITSYFVANSQNCIKGKIDQLIELKEKPLAVVLYEENEELVKKLEKKIAKNDKKKEKFQKELKEYKDFVLYFNSSIKEIIPDYWRLNDTENVKYITKKELRENELKGYAVLDLTAEAIMTDYDFLLTQEIYVITYGDSEKKRNKAVFKNHLTNINYNLPGYADKELKNSIEKLEKERENGPKILSKENIIISISLSQKYLEKILELNDKITFQEFAEEEMKKNCSQLEGNTLLFQEAIVHGKIKNELQELLPKATIQLVSADRIAQAVNNKENVLIAFPQVKRFQKAKGSIGSFSMTSVIPVTHKVVMNAKSKQIVGFIEHSGITSYSYFKKKDFKSLNEQCN